MRTGIHLALAVVIAVGAYVLYRTITDPWAAHRAEEAATQRTRARMEHVRTALIAYRSRGDRYPATLDTLAAFVQSDSAYAAEDLDAVFATPGGPPFAPDSLPFSPRTGARFVYDVVRDDATGVELYYLQDPDHPEDFIGAREPDPALRNVASWD